MKREILFRGKRIDNGEWEEGYLIVPEFAPERTFIGYLFAEDDHDIDVVEVDPETIGQYTGLKDRHNNKIFEDDIMFLDSELQQTHGIVEFGKHSTRNSKVKEVGFFVHWSNRLLRTDIGYWASRKLCQVVGNIYDNPELLEVRQNDNVY